MLSLNRIYANEKVLLLLGEEDYEQWNKNEKRNLKRINQIVNY